VQAGRRPGLDRELTARAFTRCLRPAHDSFRVVP
jgi:hypothetical protein